MKKKTFILSFVLLLAIVANASKVDTILVRSTSMNKDIQVVTVVPDKKGTYPVIYLLHGYGGNAKSWIGLKPELKKIADEKGIIFVCPDGKNSWYWDSPKNSSYRYETFVAKELISYIDANYPTIADRSKRAIAGLSMGGHGAMWLSLRNKNVFGAVGSMSGGLDIRPFPNNWEMSKQLGKESENREIWDAHTVINQIDNINDGDLAIIIDCGYADFFFEVNNDFHKKLLKYKIQHDFIVRPGDHDGPYWKNAVDYQILFFEKFFSKKK
ncbi:alpha/beta hydrolase family protein [Bacteroides sp. 519]|uniref:alpha/beta hydrolase n=1 Tax=Bacteroides sp. 519 TaxID=2302937 RepID=UPI0013D17713|nr:alpha/beta hydrolase family protein [Bacteroides sp. 519]NDV59615.1 esterase family protein [Bacteroides sp. 519]